MGTVGTGAWAGAGAVAAADGGRGRGTRSELSTHRTGERWALPGLGVFFRPSVDATCDAVAIET